MIIKSLSRKSGPRQLFNYLFKNEEKLVTENQKPIIIRHNVRSRSIDKWVKEFEQNNSLRIHKRANQVLVCHDILSFSNKDKEHVTEKMVRDIAKAYMKERGENMYVAVLHQDRQHQHLHFVVSGTKYLTGEASRLSRSQFHHLKLTMDAYQRKKYPELVNSFPRHGRTKEAKTVHIDKRSFIRQSNKAQLLSNLEKAYSQSKSLDDFLAHVKSAGHEPYYRNGHLTGVKFENGMKFRLGNLGYDKEKLAMLDALHLEEDRQLSELRELRENHSRERELVTNQDAQSRLRELEDEEKERQDQDDVRGYSREQDEEEREMEESDDREP